jgi:hypothetical protein
MSNVAAVRPWLFSRCIFPDRHKTYLNEEEEDEV